VPVRQVGEAKMPAPWCFVVASSGVQADKAGSARERYNRASLATRALVTLWNAGTGDNQSTLASLLGSRSEALERLYALTETSAHGGFSGEDLRRRLTHFVGEDARAPAALEAFRRSDAQALGELALASQSEAHFLLGNQIAETRALAHLARAHGAFASSSFGAGFGGSVWAAIDAGEAEVFARAWVAAYQQEWPSLPPVEWFITRPAPAVTELQLTS
jgi:galactokinase